MNNYEKGDLGEQVVQEAFKEMNYEVKPHAASDKGQDLIAFNQDVVIAGEIVNWWGGYIHPRRFETIVNSLSSVEEASERWLFCCGPKLTINQQRTLKALDIKWLHLPEIKEVHEWTVNNIISLIQETSESVITSFSNLLDVNDKLYFDGLVYRLFHIHLPFSFEKEGKQFSSCAFLITCGTRVGSSGVHGYG